MRVASIAVFLTALKDELMMSREFGLFAENSVQLKQTW